MDENLDQHLLAEAQEQLSDLERQIAEQETRLLSLQSIETSGSFSAEMVSVMQEAMQVMLDFRDVLIREIARLQVRLGGRQQL